MTATLVCPAPPGPVRYRTATPLRIRSVPVADPPIGPAAWRSVGRTDGDPWRPAPAPDAPGHAHLAARRYLDLVVEVLGGYRPIGHLRAHTDAGVFDGIVNELSRLGGPSTAWPGSGLIHGSGLVQVSGDRMRLRQLRTCAVRDGVVEAAAVLSRADLVRAMTVRLERTGQLWLCTHLQVL